MVLFLFYRRTMMMGVGGLGGGGGLMFSDVELTY